MISIVIPAFNEEKLLRACLDSLKNQDYAGQYEIIVVDNASTDGTARIAVELGAKVILCPERGVVYARQAGAEAASGDIIVQGDADTVYFKDWLSRIAVHFSTHPKTAGLAGAYIYTNPYFWSPVEYFGRYSTNKFAQLIFGRPVYVSGANFAFRKEAFFKTSGYDPKSLYPDQWGISRALSQVGKIVYDRTLVVSTSTRRVQKPFWSIMVDIFRNSLRILAHLARHLAHSGKKSEVKAPNPRSTKQVALILLAVSTSLFVYTYIAPGVQAFAKPIIKEGLSEQGYKFVTIPELLKIPAYNP